jgi:peptidoglycan/LPS O-acetylase OafA/YrhL
MASALKSNPFPSERFYLPELDSLRFFAFLLVFWCHVGTASGYNSWLTLAGAFGVDLFFVLSAYLISELLLREKAASGTLNVRSFWIRRILRIWPLYFTMLAVGFVLRQPFGAQRAAYSCFVDNLSPGFLGMQCALIGSLWSVSIEEPVLFELASYRSARKQTDHRSVSCRHMGFFD